MRILRRPGCSIPLVLVLAFIVWAVIVGPATSGHDLGYVAGTIVRLIRDALP